MSRSLDSKTVLQCPFRMSYSEVPNRRADCNKPAGLEKNATLLAYLLSKLINEQGGIFHLLHEKLRAGWKENLKNLSKHALLCFRTSYPILDFPILFWNILSCFRTSYPVLEHPILFWKTNKVSKYYGGTNNKNQWVSNQGHVRDRGHVRVCDNVRKDHGLYLHAVCDYKKRSYKKQR